MIRIGILGDIGSGKSYVARNFGYPVFNADHEVAQLYQQNKRIFIKLKKSLPKYFHSFPIEKEEISNAILANKNNLNKIVKIVHTEVRKKMNLFLRKNKKIFVWLKKNLPKYFHLFPIKKEEISNAILANKNNLNKICLLYTSPSPRDRTRSRMPSSA